MHEHNGKGFQLLNFYEISDQISGTWIFRFGVPARKEVRPQRQTNKSNEKIFQLKKFKSYQQDRTV